MWEDRGTDDIVVPMNRIDAVEDRDRRGLTAVALRGGVESAIIATRSAGRFAPGMDPPPLRIEPRL